MHGLDYLAVIMKKRVELQIIQAVDINEVRERLDIKEMAPVEMIQNHTSKWEENTT